VLAASVNLLEVWKTASHVQSRDAECIQTTTNE